MDKNKEAVFQSFVEKAAKRLEESKVEKHTTLYVPSIDQNIVIRNLYHTEIVECTQIEDKEDPNASDRYCIYLAVVEPDLRKVAVELKEKKQIVEYPEVVNIFEDHEITDIATEVMKLSGVIGTKRVKVIEDLKN